MTVALEAKALAGVPEACPASRAGGPVETLVQGFPGPALCLDLAGRIACANAAAAAWTVQPGGAAGLAVRSLAARVAAAGVPETARLRIAVGGEERTYDVTALPAAAFGRAPPGALLLGRDSTAEVRLTGALAQSRQMYKDLVACSSDFAWETDAAGVFGFVSRPAALGYAIEQLNGRSASDLLLPDRQPPDPLPFRCDSPVEDVELWLRRGDGGSACFLVSATPVRGADGRRAGCRGVCRDVTALRAHAAALARAQERERLGATVLHGIRDEVEPPAILAAAVRATTVALGGAQGWLLVLDDDGTARPAAAHGAGALGDATATRLVRRLRGCRADTVLALPSRGRRLLAVGCAERGAIHGILAVARSPAAAAPWSRDDRALLAAVAPQVAVAIARAQHLEGLERLSRTDELTGLLNRRAFAELVTQRLHHLGRMRRTGSLLYCDLDNFKLVNDRLGHAAGDEVLRRIAELLRQESRAGDVCARFGGDEFVLWLEEIDAAGATSIARRLVGRCAPMAPMSGSAARPFGMSIGVAASEPDATATLAALLAAADKAMYRAKRAGRGGGAGMGGER